MFCHGKDAVYNFQLACVIVLVHLDTHKFGKLKVNLELVIQF